MKNADEAPRPLPKAGVKEWDDGSTTQLYACPECGLGIGPETTCACGWRDQQRWRATMEREGLL